MKNKKGQEMKTLEYIGVFLAAAGFGLLSTGYHLAGFIVGLISCIFLVIYFYKFKQFGLFSLQIYFSFANIIGIFTNI